VVDVVINPSVANNLQKDMAMREFFCTLIHNYLYEKFKLKLKEGTIFKDLRVYVP
jgi:PIH1 N-terminal domain